MDIVTKEDMGARISQARPMNAAAERNKSLWSIEAPWQKGTFISVMWARLYAADLGRLVAEAERDELRRELEKERERGKEASRQYTEMSDRWQRSAAEVARLLKRKKK